jgi:hypothetical protein
LAPHLRGGSFERSVIQGVDIANRTNGVVSFAYTTASEASFEVTTADINSQARAVRMFRNGYIVGGTIEFFRGLDPNETKAPALAGFAHATTHELGHMLGLGHTSGPGVMFQVSGVPIDGLLLDRFSAMEQLALKLMYQRQPGNAYPDTGPERRSGTSNLNGMQIVLD